MLRTALRHFHTTTLPAPQGPSPPPSFLHHVALAFGDAMDFFRGLFKDPKQEEAAKLVRYVSLIKNDKFILMVFLLCSCT